MKGMWINDGVLHIEGCDILSTLHVKELNGAQYIEAHLRIIKTPQSHYVQITATDTDGGT